MLDPLGVDLPLAESDVYYFESRTAWDEKREPQHSERSAAFFLVGLGHLRLGQLDDAQRPLWFADRLEQLRSRRYADALLFLTGIASERGDAKSAEEHLAAAIAAAPERITRSGDWDGRAASDFLWLLGVPGKPFRQHFLADVGRDSGPVKFLRAVVDAQKDDADRREVARQLLNAAKKRTGLP